MKLDGIFGLDRTRSSLRREVMAGFATFLTMSYILAVNPALFSALPGVGGDAIFTATALVTVLGTLLMAVYAKLPYAVAPAMGLNTFFVYNVCIGMGCSWSFALMAVFVEGLIVMLLTVTRLRQFIIEAIPDSLKMAIGAGIGLYIAFIGLQSAQVVVGNEHSLVAIGDVTRGPALLCLVGLLITGVLFARRIPGSLLIGMIATALLGIPMGLSHFDSVVALPQAPRPEILDFPWRQLVSREMLVVLSTFLFVDFFGDVGTVIALGQQTGNKNGVGHEDVKLRRALFADAVATLFGASVGATTSTVYLESSVGVAQGGRSGLTAFVTALCFVAALFFSPLFLAIPAAATAPVLIIVGLMMLEPIQGLDLRNYTESIPAFICLIAMPLMFSIADGIMLGIIAYVLINLSCGRARRLNPATYVLAALFLAHYLWMA